MLGVTCEKTEDGFYLGKFTEPSIRAYQLLHVLLPEVNAPGWG